MKANLLVISHESSFGEIIHQSLSDTDSFHIHYAKGKVDAVLTVEKENCSLAMLDMELGESPLVEIGRSLRSMNPDIKIIVLADEDIPPAMDAIRPWILLRKPFQVPELIQILKTVSNKTEKKGDILMGEDKLRTEFSNTASVKESTPVLDFPWLKDVNKAAQHLTRLTLESSAQAALITRDGKLWAYAGQLSQNAANELASNVSRHWDGQKGNDLLRFLRLEATKAEHMLYATSMTPDIILAMVFDAETPFSTIRSQANDLAHSLAIANTGPLPKEAPTAIPVEKQVQSESKVAFRDGSDEELVIPSISTILKEIPSPNPPEYIKTKDPQVDAEIYNQSEMDRYMSSSVESTNPAIPSLKNPNRISRKVNPPASLSQNLGTAQEPVEAQSPYIESNEEMAMTIPSASQARHSDTLEGKPIPVELGHTRPNTANDVASGMVFESSEAGMTQLNFACLLVPRFINHYLTGDLADRLSKWMENICVAFGWRLEFLAVRPEYLQWNVTAEPNTSPGYLMRIMGEQTSEKIFAQFQSLKKENPSGDFWAPGYLIMGGLKPHPSQLVKDYIKQTRRRQGIS